MATFVRVVEGNSLSAAGRARRLSLPAVSRQLRALEADLDATLVVRSTRRLHVTDAGRRWYEHCARILREVEEARADVREAKSARGRVVVSASLTFGAVVIAPRLVALSEKHPSLSIDLRLDDQLVDLVGEGIDIAVRAGSPPPDSTAFVAHPFATMRRVLVASPSYLRSRGTPKTLRDLGNHVGLVQVTPAGAVVRWQLLGGGSAAEQTVDVRGPLRTNAPIVLRDLAMNGGGVAFLPEWLVTDALATGALRRVLPEHASAPITAWAIHRAELRGVPRVKAFVDGMREAGKRL